MFTPEVILLTILVFFSLVGIHEWGHYYFAKRAGILVREFALGFGPRLFSIKRGETRYTFRLLPLGGFVRMAGEDPEIIQIAPGQTIAVKQTDGQVTSIYLDQLDTRRDVLIGEVEHIDLDRELTVTLLVDGEQIRYVVHPQAMMVARGSETQIAPLDRQFGGKSVGKRAMAIFAGPLMNFVLAFILFLSYMWITGIPEQLQMAKIEEGSAAEAAGLHADDIILAVNGEQIGIDSQRFVDLIAASAGEEMLWTVRRGTEEKILKITPSNVDGKGKVGVHIGLYSRDATVGEVISGAGKLTWSFTEQIFIGFKMLVTLQFNLDDLGGPVRIVEVTGQAASLGMDRLVLWAALLSLYLGIFNLLPFPALDGSRLLFLGIEAVRGKPVDPGKESMVHFIGFALLMMLMVAVTYNDILRLFKG